VVIYNKEDITLTRVLANGYL